MALRAGARHGLVGRDVICGCGRRHAAACSAITSWIVEQFGLATMPRWAARGGAVHLGDHQRHVGIHAEGARLVDHHAAAPDRLRREPPGRAAAGGESARSKPASESSVSSRTWSFSAANGTRVPAERAERERHHSAAGKPRSGEDREHLGADRAGGADHGDSRGLDTDRLRPGPAPARARTRACSADSAWATFSRAITQETLIGDVTIIRRLMLLVGEVRNILAAIPGWRFMPAPIRLTLPGVVGDPPVQPEVAAAAPRWCRSSAAARRAGSRR